MKKILFLSLIIMISCSDNPSVIEIIPDAPEVIFNCNIVEDAEQPQVFINLQIVSKDSKLFNVAIQGQGLADSFYKDLDDINKSTSFTGEYVYGLKNNGSYTFLVSYEDSKKIYSEQCSGSISSITTTSTTSTSTTTTSTTTTSTTTTSTTKPKIIAPSVIFDECPENINLPSDIKLKFTVTANSYPITEIISYVDDGTYDYDPTIWDTFPKKNEYIKYTQNWSFEKNTYLKKTIFLYRVEIIDSGGLKTSKECVMNVIGPFEVTTTTQAYTYDSDIYRITNFIDDYGEVIEGSPFICEKTTDGNWGRCVSYEKWKLDPGMEKADSQWILHCSNGKQFTTATWLCNN